MRVLFCQPCLVNGCDWVTTKVYFLELRELIEIYVEAPNQVPMKAHFPQ